MVRADRSKLRKKINPNVNIKNFRGIAEALEKETEKQGGRREGTLKRLETLRKKRTIQGISNIKDVKNFRRVADVHERTVEQLGRKREQEIFKDFEKIIKDHWSSEKPPYKFTNEFLYPLAIMEERTKSKKIIPLLEKAFKKFPKEWDYGYRREILKTATIIGDKKVIPLFEMALEDNNVRVRTRALYLTDNLDRSIQLKLLKKALKNDNEEVRKIAKKLILEEPAKSRNLLEPIDLII